jgi:rare lipoprotein A
MRSLLYKLKGFQARKLKNGVVSGMIALTLSVAASASDSDTPTTTTKPHTQDSKQHHWFQIGQASWYGRYFQGKKTANGENFDMNSLTCAHRSLPLGTWIRVTNLKNRKSIFVRVNDRGPVPENRVVDLSYAAAQAVGIQGLGKVKLETVRGGDPQMARDLVAQLQIPIFLTEPSIAGWQ